MVLKGYGLAGICVVSALVGRPGRVWASARALRRLATEIARLRQADGVRFLVPGFWLSQTSQTRQDPAYLSPITYHLLLITYYLLPLPYSFSDFLPMRYIRF